MKPIPLEDIKDERLRSRIRHAMGKETVTNAFECKRRMNYREDEQNAPERKKHGNAHKSGEPNKTEAEFNRLFLSGDGIFEGVSFRLAGGSRYTPDWITVDAETGRMTAYEIKGAYRHASEGRALVAFREARERFKGVDFEWWHRGENGTWTQKHKETK